MMKVGKDYVKASGKKRKSTYRDVQFDIDGWADAKKFLPADYDLVFIKFKDKKSSSGWSIGINWDGLNINQNDEILHWKKRPD